jgi:AraC family transcriptional regulator, regulatory protein of adaptative response / DNA-3-methyladenine glycosylase II
MHSDFERCYRAVRSRDARFDGWFFTGVTSTGIYCRPSCPARTPRRENVCFHATAAAAHAAGFRACKRCRPDAVPGSPAWDERADLVGRAMRLIADGVVDRDGVGGLARRLGYSERHLNRQLAAEVGAGALALARARRAQTARLLIESSSLPFARVAFAAGFASVRQFNDTIREVYAATPTQLRGASVPAAVGTDLRLRLPFRTPLDGAALLGFLAARAVPGVEEVGGRTYRRTLRLPHGTGVAALTLHGDHVACRLRLDDLRDLTAAVQRSRRLLDLDADPQAVAEALRSDTRLAPLVRRRPGLRVPGAVDGAEVAVRALLGQQVSITAARRLAERLTAAAGKPLTAADGSLTHLFPEPDALAEADLPLPRRRADALRRLARALADGTVVLDPGSDRSAVGAALLALPGIGAWTAAYVQMRALGDPDVFPATDLALRRAAVAVGAPRHPRDLARYAERWRPWRSYAAQHLWTAPTEPAA